jgi:DNA-binding NarL/FixJ family response regulator
MTVYVIDSHPLMRDALTMLIQRIKPGLKVVPVHKMNALDSAIAKGGEPELICMELQLPDTLGMSGIQMVRASHPDAPLAVITAQEAQDYEAASLNAGANAFIEKTEPVAEVLQKLRELLVAEEAADDASNPGPTKLSKRQKQLILMLDQGLSNRDIADKLNISEHTVKVHFWRLFRRLGVNSRTQALHFARTHGWLSI